MSETREGSPHIFILANRLPVEYHAVAGWRPSPGGLVSALEPALREMDAVWVGWSGSPSVEGSHAPAPHPARSARLACVEIPMTRAEVADHYEGFCNGAIWPLYHDAIVAPVFRAEEFEVYRRINRRFADWVARTAPPDSLVWVHDYHLQLVPAFLREARPDLRIGFFLHIPFPSPSEFRMLPWGEPILRGLLGSDLIGFQTTQSAQRFIAEACRTIPAVCHPHHVDLQEGSGTRRVTVRAFPVGPPSRRFADLAASPIVRESAASMRANFGSPELILLGMDRLDYTKGIALRIRAVADLLTREEFRGRDIQFIQVAMPSRIGLAAYQQLRLTVEATLRTANAELTALGLRPIHYMFEDLSVERIAAMYVAADVMVVTPLADGMNLVCKEYVACRQDGDGRLVLSNRTGAAAQLRDAWLVEPDDVADVARGIGEALRAGDDDVRRRMAALRQSVFEHDAIAWGRSFLAALSATR